MPRSRAEFRVHVLSILGAQALGQPVSAEDAARVDAGAQAAFAFLDRADIYGNGAADYEADSIEDAPFHALARYVANEIAPIYGAPSSPDARFSAERDLRRIAAIEARRDPLAVDYF